MMQNNFNKSGFDSGMDWIAGQKKDIINTNRVSQLEDKDYAN